MKYLLVDRVKLESWVQAAKNDTDNRTVEPIFGSMYIDGTILSEEETMELFKEVFEAGQNLVHENTDRDIGYGGIDEEEEWLKFSKTL